jgi:hypothetical protein
MLDNRITALGEVNKRYFSGGRASMRPKEVACVIACLLRENSILIFEREWPSRDESNPGFPLLIIDFRDFLKSKQAPQPSLPH